VATRKTKVERWAVIATRSRPWLVVCGRVERETAREITLVEVRCAVYFSGDTRSVIGLASGGPGVACRISRAATRVVIPRDAIELELEASPEAVERWRAEPWG
jgi:hypothetical protein